MKKLSGLILPLIFGAALLGCGGGGNGGTSGFNDQALINSLERSFSDINSEDINDLDDDLSLDFFDDCFDRDEFLANMDDIFDDPERDFNIEVDRILDVDRGTSQGTVTYEFTIRDTINGDTDVINGTSTDVFVRENGEWRWAGNQECTTATARTAGAKAVWRLKTN
jgi:hypothetical protein